METFKNTLRSIASWLRLTGDRGATMVEYVLLVALVALIGAFGWQFVGTAISDTSDNVCSEIADAQSQTSGPNISSCE